MLSYVTEDSENGVDGASRFLLFEADSLKRSLEKTCRYHENSPGSAIAEDGAELALKLHRATAEMLAELGGKRSQALVADLEAYFGYGTLGGEHLPGAVHAQAGEKIVRSFAKGGAEKAMEMKFGKAGFASCLPQQNVGIIFGGEQIASAAEPAKGVVIEKPRHEEIILASRSWKETGHHFFLRAAELAATAERIRALKAASLIFSPSWMSMARRAFPSRLELKSFLGSSREAPRAKVSFTA